MRRGIAHISPLAQAARRSAAEELRALTAAFRQAQFEMGNLRAKSAHDALQPAALKPFLTDAKESMATVFKNLVQDTLTANSRQISE